jgi:hypothetical protein
VDGGSITFYTVGPTEITFVYFLTIILQLLPFPRLNRTTPINRIRAMRINQYGTFHFFNQPLTCIYDVTRTVSCCKPLMMPGH